jgi:hypothetical protein
MVLRPDCFTAAGAFSIGRIDWMDSIVAVKEPIRAAVEAPDWHCIAFGFLIPAVFGWVTR